MAQTATPTPGAPPAQLTVSTTYPSITVDPGGTAKFPLQVTSPVVERVDLTVTGAPDGYTTTLKGGGLIVGSVTTTGHQRLTRPGAGRQGARQASRRHAPRS